jgi:hypothetical protein
MITDAIASTRHLIYDNLHGMLNLSLCNSDLIPNTLPTTYLSDVEVITLAFTF